MDSLLCCLWAAVEVILRQVSVEITGDGSGHFCIFAPQKVKHFSIARDAIEFAT